VDNNDGRMDSSTGSIRMPCVCNVTMTCLTKHKFELSHKNKNSLDIPFCDEDTNAVGKVVDFVRWEMRRLYPYGFCVRCRSRSCAVGSSKCTAPVSDMI